MDDSADVGYREELRLDGQEVSGAADGIYEGRVIFFELALSILGEYFIEVYGNIVNH